jgi:7-cyano-7-deazaguanine tRNA-ribosyltransferase
LVSALKRLRDYKAEFERYSPSYKGRGIFFFDSSSLTRPEVTRHSKRLMEYYTIPDGSHTLLLVPAPKWKPFSKSKEYKKLREGLNQEIGDHTKIVHVCFYTPPFGVVPVELSETYPMSQFELPDPLDHETLEYVAEQVGDYITYNEYSYQVLYTGKGKLDNLVREKCAKVMKTIGRDIIIISNQDLWSEEALGRLFLALKKL